MTIRIDIESTDVERKISKADNPYFLQTGYAHTFDRQGIKKRYPEFIQFPVRADGNNPVPYAVGEYEIAPQAITVNQYGSLELGYLSLNSVKSK
jgi:hypothetical protein